MLFGYKLMRKKALTNNGKLNLETESYDLPTQVLKISGDKFYELLSGENAQCVKFTKPCQKLPLLFAKRGITTNLISSYSNSSNYIDSTRI